MQDREYLRIKVMGLKVHYDVLPENNCAPILTGGFEKRAPVFGADRVREKLGEQDAFQHFVVECLERIESKLDLLIGLKEREEAGKSYRFYGEVVDLGGGGISLKTLTPPDVGSALDLCLFARYGDPRPIYAVGTVCWVEDHKDEKGEPYTLAGVEFAQINEDDRKAIVRLVFQTERKLRRSRTKAGE
jgi:hypothetical protein